MSEGEQLKRGKERRTEIELEIDRAMEELGEWYTGRRSFLRALWVWRPLY
jgi:hypothetical protein